MDFFNVDLYGVNLKGVDISCANLDNVTFLNTNISDVNFKSTIFRSVRFFVTDMEGVNLEDAKVEEPDWIDKITPTLKTGADWIRQNFEVSKELKTFTDRYGNKYQAYEILRKSPLTT